jgi:hypothetical protein
MKIGVRELQPGMSVLFRDQWWTAVGKFGCCTHCRLFSDSSSTKTICWVNLEADGIFHLMVRVDVDLTELVSYL